MGIEKASSYLLDIMLLINIFLHGISPMFYFLFEQKSPPDHTNMHIIFVHNNLRNSVDNCVFLISWKKKTEKC